jgi:hypothetical protein
MLQHQQHQLSTETAVSAVSCKRLQSQVHVLTILKGAAKKKERLSRQSKSRTVGNLKSAASAASKSNGSAAGGSHSSIDVAQASGHVPESDVRALPAAIASTASGPPARREHPVAARAEGGKK